MIKRAILSMLLAIATSGPIHAEERVYSADQRLKAPVGQDIDRREGDCQSDCDSWRYEKHEWNL
jgi:hypothetical protein